MRAWVWFGLVLSVAWLVGFGVWEWISSGGDRAEWYAIRLQRCWSSSDIKRQGLPTDDAQRDQMIASISREYYTCTERVKATFDAQMEGRRSHLRRIMEANAGVLAAIWLLILGGGLIARLLAPEFRQERA
jgi:hypothetical protein